MGQFVSIEAATALPARVVAVRTSRTHSRSFLPVWHIVAATLIAATAVAWYLGLKWVHLLFWIPITAASVTALVVFGAIFFQVCVMAFQKEAEPLRQLRARWLGRGLRHRLALPLVAAPIFMAAFVALKSAATMTLPYNWDRFLTDLDYNMFGVDPWVPLHIALNNGIIPGMLEYAYVGWQLLLPATMAFVAIWMKPKDVIVFYSAMFMTWIVAGVFAAALMHSAGPVFAYIFDDELGSRFEPLSTSLLYAMDPDSHILNVHKLLALSVGDLEVGRGGGISAMPSVHVAVTIIFLLAVWHRRYWRVAAALYAAVIWLGSVYFGYHYVTDGPLAAVIAVACWFASKEAIDRLYMGNGWIANVRRKNFGKLELQPKAHRV